MQNLLRAGEAVRARGRLAAPMGDLAFPFVSTDDVGVAATVALATPAAHAGATYALTGAIALSYESIADALTACSNARSRTTRSRRSGTSPTSSAAGSPEWRARDLAFIASAYAPADNATTRDLPALLGRPAESLREFLAAHRDVFLLRTGGQRSGW